MRKLASLNILASCIVMLVGCSKAPSTPASLKNNNLGVIFISSGKPSNYTLTDGRACTITPILSTSGNAKLTVTIAETKGAKKTLIFEVPPDGHPDTFRIDKNTAITVAPCR